MIDLGLAKIPLRNTKPGRPHPKTKFRPDEDAILLKLVKEHGIESWEIISSKIPGRNARQCRERYLNYLDPSINRDPWTPEEDARLLATARNIGSHWVEMMTYFPGRTENQLKSRWKLLVRRMEVGPLIFKNSKTSLSIRHKVFSSKFDKQNKHETQRLKVKPNTRQNTEAIEIDENKKPSEFSIFRSIKNDANQIDDKIHEMLFVDAFNSFDFGEI